MINGFSPALSRMPSPLMAQQTATSQVSQQQAGWGFNQPVLPMPNPSSALLLNPINNLMMGVNSNTQFSSTSNATSGFGNQWFNSLGNSLGNFGNSVFGGINNGLSGLGTQFSNGINNLSTIMPSMLGFGSNMPIQQVQRPQVVQNVPRTRPTGQQIFQNIGMGAQQAFQDLGSMMKQHGSSVMSFGGGMAVASAVCPFAGGALAATGATALANQMANGSSIPA